MQIELRSDFTTGDQNGARLKWSVTMERWGRYLVRICDVESGHCTGDYFYAGYSWDDDDGQGKREAAAMLAIASDKPNTGDNVRPFPPEKQARR